MIASELDDLSDEANNLVLELLEVLGIDAGSGFGHFLLLLFRFVD
jgi:hypothetical protein